MKTANLVRSRLEQFGLSGWVNRYSVTLLVFVVWMMFFDKHNMIVQYQLHRSAVSYKDQIERDNELLHKAKDELNVLSSHTEKYAREKYNMHKPDEEVFIIVNE